MVAVLGLVVLATVVLVAVVFVLVVAAAGFSAGFAVGPVVGSPAAGVALAGDLSSRFELAFAHRNRICVVCTLYSATCLLSTTLRRNRLSTLRKI